MGSEVGRRRLPASAPARLDSADAADRGGLEDALSRSRAAAERGSPSEALRWADRAQRLCGVSPQIVELKARLLLSQSGADSALNELLKINEQARTPAVHALLAEIYFELGRDAEGLAVLQSALTLFAVSEGDALAECAGRYAVKQQAGPKGWIGVSPRFQVWGAVAAVGDPELSIALEGRLSAATFGQRSKSGGLFEFAATDLSGAGLLTARARGASLVGSGINYPPDVRIDGRCHVEDGVLRGWVVLGWAPQLSPSLIIRDQVRVIGRLRSAPAADHSGRHLFELPIPRLRFGREISVEAELADGRCIALPTSPAMIDLPAPPRRRRAQAAPVTIRRPPVSRRPVAVIVPAYEGRADTARCLDSVGSTVDGSVRLIIVNDASPNAGLAEDLRTFAGRHGATLLENARNLGFAASVNRALRVNPDHDAVILNADAEVFGDWLERLRNAAYSAPNIGTVTPLSDAGAIATYPAGSAALEGSDAADVARLAALVNDGERIETPTGVGFCLYVRRDCLDETGGLDVRAFGRGYGEENDFCLRASKQGWRHVIATDVFVRHSRSRSFGASAAAALRERNTVVMRRRHPGYAALVVDFMRRDPLHHARRRLDEARLKAKVGPFHLLVTLADPGGVDRVIERRWEAILDAGGTPLVLRPDIDSDLVWLSAPGLERGDLSYDPDVERSGLLGLMAELRPRQLELHHAFGHDSTLIDDIIALGVQVTAFIHDYSLICPRLVLIGGEGRYCGEPDLDGCAACVAANGSSLREDISAAALRQRSARWLAAATRVVAPSRDTQQRLERYFPGIPIDVEAWESDLAQPPISKPAVSRAIKVAIIGAIGAQKGYPLLVECARDAAERLLPMEFVVIGYTVNDAEWLSLGNTFVTGRFDQADITDLIGREAPDVALFASVTPETHCFSLTHAFKARLPVVAFDLGAVAERLRASESGATLLPIGADAATVNNALLSTVLRTHGGPPLRRANLPGPGGRGLVGTDRPRLALGDGGGELGSPVVTQPATVLTASPQLLTLGRGIFSFSVRSAAPRRIGQDGDVVLPALQIGLAPGVPIANVEIMTGVRPEGAWLYDEGDVVIAKVKVDGSAVLVTSYSLEGLTPLSIDIEQLDARVADPASPTLPGAAPAGDRLPAPVGPRFSSFRREIP